MSHVLSPRSVSLSLAQNMDESRGVVQIMSESTDCKTSVRSDPSPNAGWMKLRTWLSASPADKPPAVVLGGSVNGLSFVRSLGRRGVRTLLLDAEPLLGTYTRHGRVLLLPDPAKHANEWLELLEYLGSAFREPGVLFVTSDAYTVFVAEHETSLRRFFRFVMPSAETTEKIVNKRLQYDIAQAAGVPIPLTFFPGSVDEARECAGAVEYPCILKPYKSHLGRKKASGKVAVVESREQLLDSFAKLNAPDTEFMIQEIVPGGDDGLYGYLGFWAENREIAWLTKRKLRQSSRFGDGSYQVTVDAPQVADLSRVLLKAFDYRGFVGIEFKHDPRDGSYRLMEINPRTVSGNQLAISAGIDFPWLGYQYLVSHPGTACEASPFRIGVEYVNEEWDLRAYLRLRKLGQLSLASWLRTLWRAPAKAIGAWDDPRPLLVLLWRLARAAIAAPFGKDVK
jgi:D-aspartate ligase